jgi:thiol-disulfide isomerase/thioredoxin
MTDRLFTDAVIWNKADEVESLDCYDVIGLYFSASWCPPCRSFTPKLNDAWKLAGEAGKKVQIILVSGDQMEADY